MNIRRRGSCSARLASAASWNPRSGGQSSKTRASDSGIYLYRSIYLSIYRSIYLWYRIHFPASAASGVAVTRGSRAIVSHGRTSSLRASLIYPSRSAVARGPGGRCFCMRRCYQRAPLALPCGLPRGNYLQKAGLKPLAWQQGERMIYIYIYIYICICIHT